MPADEGVTVRTVTQPLVLARFFPVSDAKGSDDIFKSRWASLRLPVSCLLFPVWCLLMVMQMIHVSYHGRSLTKSCALLETFSGFTEMCMHVLN